MAMIFQGMTQLLYHWSNLDWSCQFSHGFDYAEVAWLFWNKDMDIGPSGST